MRQPTLALIGFAGLLSLVVTMCSSQKTATTPQGIATLNNDDRSPVMAYVAAQSLNCRATASADAKVVVRLRYGDALVLTESQNGWSKAQRSAGDCWVATRFVTDTQPAAAPTQTANLSNANTTTTTTKVAGTLAGAGINSYAQASGKRFTVQSGVAHRKSGTSVSRKRSRKAKKVRTARPSHYNGGNCPCSGSMVCIGPRGGRYCITSGGNKRYGV